MDSSVSDSVALAQTLKSEALNIGFTTAGIAGLEPFEGQDFVKNWLRAGFHGEMDYLSSRPEFLRNPDQVLAGARSALVVTLNYNQSLPGGAKVARYALGRDYHKVLRSKLKLLGQKFDAELGSWRACVDTAPLPERELAHRAGLGWFGKNTNLIDSKRGSWFFIGVLLTTRLLPADKPSAGGCGTCTKCIDACPTGAIVQLGDRWAVDSRKCLSYLTIEHRSPFDEETDLHGWLYGCDICQEVCPFNEPRSSQPLRAVETTEPQFFESPFTATAEEVAQWGEADWDSATRGRALRRAKLDQWKRNAVAILRSEPKKL